MQSQLQLQADRRRLFDYCQECQFYHQAFIENGKIFVQPCQRKIYDPSAQQKVQSETTMTNVSKEVSSSNSISNVSIKYHYSPISNPSQPQIQTQNNIYVAKPPQKTPIYISSKQKLKNSQKILVPQTNKLITTQKIHQAFRNNNILPVIQYNNLSIMYNHFKPINTSTITSNFYRQISPQNNLKKYNNINNLIPCLNKSACQTPQFGSQSLIYENKENNLVNKSPLENNQLLENIQIKNKIYQIEDEMNLDNRIQKTQSQIESNQYCCFGYIKKCG